MATRRLRPFQAAAFGVGQLDVGLQDILLRDLVVLVLGLGRVAKAAHHRRVFVDQLQLRCTR